ncbi:3-isopropylmalate dehydratase small subunit [Alteromonas sp. C1M14]|uniref:3-isopropylmalate dehydratase small subunit n=1 Tax=Alteromonas sp. C1M14 TaxID=2841567 RepID=UPI001C092F5C|nr:3-isopropylmalate dehydratase small subunit [Alteromonas sp. C1M14]MBU2980035.1 3-isopropylmalate dehydratase small subunit [Alteromonas sp. C1M14]
MTPFVHHSGVAAPLLRINIDTDAIIPSREMRRVSKKGLGEGLFASWRYVLPDSRELNPDFILNQPAYHNTTIILGGNNFGCGSSREHAVWALAEYGIRAIVAPTFGAIFYQNCIRNGILPVGLDTDAIASLAQDVSTDPQQRQVAIDLAEQQVTSASGLGFSFDIEAGHKEMLLKGLDSIGVSLQHITDIQCFEKQYHQQRPWLLGRG